MTEELNQIIETQVRAKVSELSNWKQVRWEGGRLYFETTTISNEIADYDTETQILYLEILLSKNYVIQDNLPSSAPDITLDFRNWITKMISVLKVTKIQEERKLLVTNILKNKKRPTIPYRIKTRLQKEINSTCPFCGNEDVDHFQIHHINENPGNNEFENLLMVCANCHSKITKRDISEKNVREKKEELTQIY